MKKVTVVDYRLGNLFSMRRALEHVGAQVDLTDNPEAIRSAERLIIPGVGAFGEGMENLRRLNILSSIQDFLQKKKPFLGICLGMQLLMSESEELGVHEGLNLIKGSVLKLDDNKIDGVHYKIPHIGWNTIQPSNGKGVDKDPLLEGIPSGTFFYFVHSFGVFPKGKENWLTSTSYGKNDFCSIVKNNNVYGCQFHPEKSGELGLRILFNFLNL